MGKWILYDLTIMEIMWTSWKTHGQRDYKLSLLGNTHASVTKHVFMILSRALECYRLYLVFCALTEDKDAKKLSIFPKKRIQPLTLSGLGFRV